MNFSGLMTKFVVFIVLMLLGYLFVRKKVVGEGFARDAGKITLDVFMSATILNSVIANPPQISGGELTRTIVIITGTFILSAVIAAFSARIIHCDKSNESVLELLMSLPNNMFIALPVLQQILGSESVFYVALSTIPFNIYLYTYGVWRLKGDGSEKFRLKDLMGVPLIATLLALFIFTFRIPMPALVKELTSAMSGATMPLSMIVLGASMGTVSIFDAARSKHSYFVSAVRLVISPLLTYFVLRLFGVDPFMLAIATIIAASPSAVIVTVMTLQYGHDAVYSSKAILMSTVISMVTIPLWVYIIM